MGVDGCVEVPSSSWLCVWGVCGGGAKPSEPSNAMTTKVTILATYQCTNTPTTLVHSWRGVGACWMYQNFFCNLSQPTCSGGTSNNWLERHQNISGKKLTRTQPEQRLPKV